MTYHARDVNGYLGDIASIGGWNICRRILQSAGGPLRAFVETGGVRPPEVMVSALQALLSDPERAIDGGSRSILEAMLKTAKKAKLVYHLSDGTDDSEDNFDELATAEEFAVGKYAEVKRALDDIEIKAATRMQKVFEEIKDAVVAKVKRAASNKALSGLAADLKLPLWGDFRNLMTELMRRAHDQGRKDARREVRVAKAEQFADDSFTPRDAMRWLRDKEVNVSGITSDTLTNSIKTAIVNAIKVGMGENELADKIASLFDPYVGNKDVLKDGEPLESYRIKTAIRTVTTEAYNHGRMTEYMDPEMLPFLQGVRYSAILDERTTDLCESLDGKIFRMGDPDLASLIPPNHFNCRSIIVPVVVGEEVDSKDFITAAQKGRAKDKADVRFLEQTGG